MAGLVRACAERTLKIGVVGITLGALAGLSSWLFADSLSSAARIDGSAYWGIAILPTATLWVLVKNDLRTEDLGVYRTRARGAETLLVINVAGSILASILFYVLATNITGLAMSLDFTSVYQSVGRQMGWPRFAVVLAAAILGAGVVATWLRGRVGTQETDVVSEHRC